MKKMLCSLYVPIRVINYKCYFEGKSVGTLTRVGVKM